MSVCLIIGGLACHSQKILKESNQFLEVFLLNVIYLAPGPSILSYSVRLSNSNSFTNSVLSSLGTSIADHNEVEAASESLLRELNEVLLPQRVQNSDIMTPQVSSTSNVLQLCENQYWLKHQC